MWHTSIIVFPFSRAQATSFGLSASSSSIKAVFRADETSPLDSSNGRTLRASFSKASMEVSFRQPMFAALMYCVMVCVPVSPRNCRNTPLSLPCGGSTTTILMSCPRPSRICLWTSPYNPTRHGPMPPTITIVFAPFSMASK